MPQIAPVDSPPRRLRRRSSGGRTSLPGEPFPINRRGRAKLPFKRELSAPRALALVGALTIAGATIRLALTRGLSVDELRTAGLAHLPFSQLITHLRHAGTVPPLHPVLEWCMVRLFGDGNLAVRLPALVAGVVLIPAVAWLGAELYDRRTAVVAALFVAVAPVLVWYSQEASGYMLVALFGTLAIVGAARATRRGRPVDWVLHAVSAALAVWSDWSGIFIVLATEIILVAGFVRRRHAEAPTRDFLVGWGLDSVALICQLVPLAALFVSQLHGNGGLNGVMGVAASGVSFYSAVSNVSWALFGFHPGAVTSVLSALWPLVMLASLVTVGRGVSRSGWLLVTCAIVPALGVFVLGLAAPQAFDVRYFVVAAAPVFLLLAATATRWPRGWLGRFLVAGGVLIVLAGALVDEQLDRNNPRRYDYQSALTQVRRDALGGAAVFYEPSDLRVALHHYAPALRASTLTTQLPTRRQVRSVFVVTSFSNRPSLRHLLDREIGALRATRHLVRYRRYPGVNVWWFR